jgi:hypothetical protein
MGRSRSAEVCAPIRLDETPNKNGRREKLPASAAFRMAQRLAGSMARIKLNDRATTGERVVVATFD